MDAIPNLAPASGPTASADNTSISTPLTHRHYVANAPMANVDDAGAAGGGGANDAGREQHMHLLSPGADEHAGGPETNLTGEVGGGVSRSIEFRLYTSHFLSTWNARLFEFGAALFLTSVFPGTLLPVSVYCLVRNAGCIVFAQPVGRWISKGHRLRVVRASIVGQRVSVAASCALLLVLLGRKKKHEGELHVDHEEQQKNMGVFAVVVLLAVVEKLCSTMNTISVERDWVSCAFITLPCIVFSPQRRQPQGPGYPDRC